MTNRDRRTMTAPAAPGRQLLPLLGLVAIMAWSAATASDAVAEEDLTDAQRTEIETLIQKYIEDHPEVILESVRAYSKRQEEAKRAEAQSNLAALSDQIMNDPMAPVAGNPDGDVTLVEFFDYRCAYCKRSLDAVMTVLKEDPNLRVVFKELPILTPESRRAAKAAMAAKDQGKYLDFHYALMSSRGSLDDGQIMDIAAEVGLDVERLAKDMEAPEIEAYLDRVQDLARALQIEGTPTFIVENQIFRGAVDIDTMRRAIAEQRAG